MRIKHPREPRRLESDCGQTSIIVILVLSIFLLGAIGFAVDIANLWFHRQSAQNAADAACTASAMDMLLGAESASPPGTETSWGNFTLSTSVSNCSSTTTATPCKYAALNGYNGNGLVASSASNQVTYTFSNAASLPGIASCSTSPTPKMCFLSALALPVMRVNVTDRVPIYFAAMISGSKTMDVGAQARCGVVATQSPVPLLVLDPITNSFSLSGTPGISIYGGPTQSIQVNSSDSGAASGGGTVDLSLGGPGNTGSNMGVYGGPATSCCSFNGGTTGSWVQPHSPISDPFASVSAPAAQGAPVAQAVDATFKACATAAGAAAGVINFTCAVGNPCPSVPGPFTKNGHTCAGWYNCPDSGGCDEYAPGDYAGGIQVKNATAIFDPGIYNVTGGFTLDSNSTARPSNATGSGIGGTMFYLIGTGGVSVVANSGKSFFPFNTTVGTGSTINGLLCTATSALPNNLTANTNLDGGNIGTILMAPCTGPYGDPLVAAGLTDPNGTQRGMLFFQDRSAKNVTFDWGGGGAFALVGSMYIHSCNSTGTGTGCGAAGTYYDDLLYFHGNPGSGSYVLGDIVIDNLQMNGTPAITMDLNPNAAYWILKATLLE